MFALSQAAVVDELRKRQRAVSLMFFDMVEVRAVVQWRMRVVAVAAVMVWVDAGVLLQAR